MGGVRCILRCASESGFEAPIADPAGCPSGQWERTVNPSAYAYVGSHPTPATQLSPDPYRVGAELFCGLAWEASGSVPAANRCGSTISDLPVWCYGTRVCNLS